MIIRECLAPRWEIEDSFMVKCHECGVEYPDHVDKCDTPDCKGDINPPDPRHRMLAKKLIKHPNPNENDTFYKLMQGLFWYDLGLDNTFIYVAHAPMVVQGRELWIPKEYYIEDTRYIRPVCDDRGTLGDPNQLFCLSDYQPDDYYAPPQTHCPKCGRLLEKTAYVQRIGGAVKARFAWWEIIHDSSDRVPPNMWGESRIVSLWKQIVSMGAMDDFNLEAYTEGKLGSIINFPAHDQREVNEIMTDFETESLRKRVYDPVLRRFRTSKKIRTIMLASKEPIRVTKVMEDFQKMQSLEYYGMWREAINFVYGIMPLFGGIVESGKSGTNPQAQITVQDRGLLDYQNRKADLINRLFRKFGITDVKFVFNGLALRDKLYNANIGQIVANTALTWDKAEFPTRLNAQGKLEVGRNRRKPQKESVIPPAPEKVPKISPASNEITQPDSKLKVKAEGAVTSETGGINSPLHENRKRKEKKSDDRDAEPGIEPEKPEEPEREPGKDPDEDPDEGVEWVVPSG